MVGGEQDSSSMRLQAYPAHRALLEAGIESHLTYVGDPSIWPKLPRAINPAKELKGAQVVIIAKSFGQVAKEYSEAALAEGATLITQLRTDEVSVEEVNYQPLDKSDWVVSPFMTDRLQSQLAVLNPNPAHKPLVIPDPLETWLPPLEQCEDQPEGKNIVLWIGRKRHWPSLLALGDFLPDNWQLVTISDNHLGDHLWDPDLAAKLLASCQALMITRDFKQDDTQGHSSSIRMINGLACGKAVLAPPTDAYLDASPEMKGWIACQNGDHYRQALTDLSDPLLRATCSQEGLEVFGLFNPGDPAVMWRQLIKETLI